MISADDFWLELARRDSRAMAALPKPQRLDNARWPLWRFPWTGLETSPLLQSGEIRLAAYGSLMNAASATRTLQFYSLRTRQPAIVLGAKRVYDYVMPPHVLDRYGIPAESSHRAALNAYFTGGACDFLNAVLLTLTVDDIPALRVREIDYDLTPVPVMPGASSTSPLAVAYLLTAPYDRQFAGRQEEGLAMNLLPGRSYHAVVCDGCREISSAWLELFLSTTWLKDGRPVSGATV